MFTHSEWFHKDSPTHSASSCFALLVEKKEEGKKGTLFKDQIQQNVLTVETKEKGSCYLSFIVVAATKSDQIKSALIMGESALSCQILEGLKFYHSDLWICQSCESRFSSIWKGSGSYSLVGGGE